MKKTLLWVLLLAGIALYTGYDMLTKRMKGDRWDYLTPETKAGVLEILRRAELTTFMRKGKRITVGFWSGFRDVAGQQENINNGVSFVSHPLNSYHPWGEAADITFFDSMGLPIWPDVSDGDNDVEDAANWEKLGKIGEAVGFDWGGRWRKFDAAHFQRRGVKPSTLREKYDDKPLAYLAAKGVIA